MSAVNWSHTDPADLRSDFANRWPNWPAAWLHEERLPGIGIGLHHFNVPFAYWRGEWYWGTLGAATTSK